MLCSVACSKPPPSTLNNERSFSVVQLHSRDQGQIQQQAQTHQRAVQSTPPRDQQLPQQLLLFAGKSNRLHIQNAACFQRSHQRALARAAPCFLGFALPGMWRLLAARIFSHLMQCRRMRLASRRLPPQPQLLSPRHAHFKATTFKCHQSVTPVTKARCNSKHRHTSAPFNAHLPVISSCRSNCSSCCRSF